MLLPRRLPSPEPGSAWASAASAVRPSPAPSVSAAPPVKPARASAAPPPELLYAKVVEADERVGADGTLLRPLDGAALAVDLQAARASGLASVAIVFMHGWRFTAHELAAERLARAAGFTQVSVSHKVSPLMKLVGRGDTTVVDAYLSPILRRYVDTVAAVKEICPNGVDFAFECVGHPELIRQSIDTLDWGGSCVLLGVPKLGTEASFVVNTMYNDKSILGCRYGSARPHHDIPLFVELYKAGRLKLDELVSATYAIGDVEQALTDMHDGKLNRGVLSIA